MGGGAGTLTRLLSWNLYHGRDYPPELKGGAAWKWLGRPVDGEDHVLVNRNLFYEFAALLAAADWDVALLQEVPPRWAGRLAEATGSEVLRTLTARNWLRPFTFPLARMRPHLVGSWEGGSNLILVRGAGPTGSVVEAHSAVMARRPERRMVTFVALEGGLCLANLHASLGPAAERDLLLAAEMADTWAAGRPLVFGGDFNARPDRSGVFRRLEADYGLAGATAEKAIDHLLSRGVERVEPATAWRRERRDVPDQKSDLLIRLSDHRPVSLEVRL